MKRQFTDASALWAILPLVFFLLVSASSCSVRLLPDYDSSLAEDILKVSMDIDRFYSRMLELSVSGTDERAYQNFGSEYIEIELAIRSLYLRNSIRPLNKQSTRISEIALELWQKYKNEHKEDELISDGEIILNRTYMLDLFKTMLAAEEWKPESQ